MGGVPAKLGVQHQLRVPRLWDIPVDSPPCRVLCEAPPMPVQREELQPRLPPPASQAHCLAKALLPLKAPRIKHKASPNLSVVSWQVSNSTAPQSHPAPSSPEAAKSRVWGVTGEEQDWEVGGESVLGGCGRASVKCNVPAHSSEHAAIQ